MTDETLQTKISSFAHTELSIKRFAASGIINFCDFYRINHLGQSRTKGFGLLDIVYPETEDLRNLILLRFPDLLDNNEVSLPTYAKRLWASMRLSVYLSREANASSENRLMSFDKEIDSGLLGISAAIELCISIAYEFKRRWHHISGRLFK
jgi:hypothetical protein